MISLDGLGFFCTSCVFATASCFTLVVVPNGNLNPVTAGSSTSGDLVLLLCCCAAAEEEEEEEDKDDNPFGVDETVFKDLGFGLEGDDELFAAALLSEVLSLWAVKDNGIFGDGNRERVGGGRSLGSEPIVDRGDNTGGKAIPFVVDGNLFTF